MDCAFISPRDKAGEHPTHTDTQTSHRLIRNRGACREGGRRKTPGATPNRHHDTDRETNKDDHMVNFTLDRAEGEQR